MNNKKTNSILPFIAYFNICFFWGTSSVANRIGALGLGALTMGMIRFLTAGSLILIWLLVKKVPLKMSQHDLIALSVSSFLMYFVYTLLLLFISERVDSSISTVVLCMVSVYIILCDSIYQRKLQVGLIGIGGILLCFVGVAVTVIFELTSGQADPLGILLLIISPVSWGIGTTFLKNSNIKTTNEQQILVQAVLPAILFTACALLSGEAAAAEYRAESVLAGMYMGVADSIIGLSSYIFLLKIWRTSVVSTYAFVNPIVGIIMSRLILGEAITANKVIGMIVILIGVYIIQSEKKLTKLLMQIYVSRQVDRQLNKE